MVKRLKVASSQTECNSSYESDKTKILCSASLGTLGALGALAAVFAMPLCVLFRSGEQNIAFQRSIMKAISKDL